MVQCYVNAIHAGVQVNTRLMVMWERTANESYPENDNRSLQAKNRQLQLKDRKVLLGCNNLMPMVVKIVGSTPTIRTINESEVVSVLDTEQNKQYMRQGVGCKL